jgi:hypothetical protein
MISPAKVTGIPSFVSLTDKVFFNFMEKGLLTKDELLSISCNCSMLNQNELILF